MCCPVVTSGFPPGHTPDPTNKNDQCDIPSHHVYASLHMCFICFFGGGSLYLQKDAIGEEEQSKNTPAEEGGEEGKEEAVEQVAQDEPSEEPKVEEEDEEEGEVEETEEVEDSVWVKRFPPGALFPSLYISSIPLIILFSC